MSLTGGDGSDPLTGIPNEQGSLTGRRNRPGPPGDAPLCSNPVGSTFGSLFRLSTWCESHGAGIGVVVDGCPPRLALSEGDLQADLDRRRPGQSRLTTQRDEADRVEILSGVFEGRTTGAPIALLVRNDDARSGAYDHLKDLYRPSHADFTYDAKYGHRDWRGGGRSSARETVGRVAAGAIARRLLADCAGIEVLGWVSRIHDVVGGGADRQRRACLQRGGGFEVAGGGGRRGARAQPGRGHRRGPQ